MSDPSDAQTAYTRRLEVCLEFLQDSIIAFPNDELGSVNTGEGTCCYTLDLWWQRIVDALESRPEEYVETRGDS